MFFLENSKYLKSIADTAVTECDEIIIVMDNVSTKKTIATNFMSTASIICHTMKLRDFYFLHIVLLAIILLLTIIIIIYCHYLQQKSTI